MSRIFLSSRHGWDNYDDQVTYDQDYAQIEYRERTQSCGVNKKTCAGGVQYPVRPKVRGIEIKRTRQEEPSQQCPWVSMIDILYLLKVRIIFE